MKGIKKILALVFVAVFAVGMLAACGGGNGGDAAPAGSGGAAAPAISKPALSAFMMRTPPTT